MQRIWILAESRDGAPLPIVSELAAAARSFAPTVEAFTWGGDAKALAAALGSHGISRLYDVGDIDASLAGPPVAGAIAARIADGDVPDAIFFGATYNGRDVAARLSAQCDRPVITNVVGMEEHDGSLVSVHAVFGGTETAKARFTGVGPGIFVIRSKSFVAEATGGAEAEVISSPAPTLGATNGAHVVARHVTERSGPSLDEASLVVSGGRGLGSQEHYALIVELAELLHGAPGASRAIVDAGWVPYAYQVGQTGKTVKPDVYLAFGISGATQHLVGMKGANHIIAVNKDATAPIFQVADLAVVGDVHDVLPKLVDALKARS